MSIIANNNHNYSHSSSAFHSSSHESSSGQLDRYDLEVEEILNDIGFFANDDHDYVDPLNNLAGEPEPGFPMSYIFPPTLMAPVSPDHPPSHSSSKPHQDHDNQYYHHNNNNNNQNHHHNNMMMMMGMSSGNYNPTVTPSASVQDIQTFSVPNPMAMSSSIMEDSPSMSSTSSPMMMPAIQERAIVNNDNSHNKKAAVTKAPKTKAPSTKKEPSSKGRKRKLMDHTTAPEASAVLSSMPASAALAAAQEALANHAAAVGRASHHNPNRDEGLTEEDLEERRQRNREHAKRSRQRKKSLTSTLEESVEDLKAENTKLREQIYAMIGPQKAQAMLDARQESSRTQFLQGLMQPANRIMDEKTLSFLKSLRKNVTLDDDDSSSNNDNNNKN